MVLTLPAEYQERLPARQRAPVAVGVLVAMIVVMAFELLPNSAAALLAALAMVAGGCVKLDAIYRIVSWKTVVLIAGMLPLATALTKTGATVLMAKGLVAALGSLGPVAMLAARISGDGACRTVHFQLGNCGIDRPGCHRSRADTAGLPAGVCNDGGDRLLCRLRDARIVSGEYAGDGTRRLRFRRLCQGRAAVAVADDGGDGRAGRGDLSRARHLMWVRHLWEKH